MTWAYTDHAARTLTDNALRFLASQGGGSPLGVIQAKLADARTSKDDVRNALLVLERQGAVYSVRRNGDRRDSRALVFVLAQPVAA